MNENVSPNELYDLSKARLVYQCDIRDTITRLVNYDYDDEVGASVPKVMVNGNNEGIRHSFSVKEDLFATGTRNLVNFKRYYYMAVAYASNEYKKYDPNSPSNIDGQKRPYLSSRKGAIGEIISYEGIPHSPNPENGGTINQVDYGYEIPVTRIDGWGNGGRWTEITEEAEQSILMNNKADELSYKSGAGPVEIMVIDPLNLPENDFELYFTAEDPDDLRQAGWYLVNLTTNDTVFSKQTINVANDQLIPEWGISIAVIQTEYENISIGVFPKHYTEPINATLTFADSSKRWLSGVEDSDNFDFTNWIRSGLFDPETEDCIGPVSFNPCYYKDKGVDFDQNYENILNGIVGPFNLLGTEFTGMLIGHPDVNYDPATGNPSSWFDPKVAQLKLDFSDLHGVDIILTSDPTYWTQCPVIETGMNNNQSIGGSSIMKLRTSNSRNKQGGELETTGMSWFPGYAIDVETGERLNMAFGENSWLHGSNGTDMLWNPTS